MLVNKLAAAVEPPMQRIIVLSLVFLLTACMSASDLRRYSDFDMTEKTMTVPAGGGLIADLKDVLKQDGWKLAIDRGPNIIEGGTNSQLKEFNTFKTRYRLMVRYNQFDVCIGHFDPAENYNISLVDNNTGEEVMAMAGRACQGQIIDRFKKFIELGK
jgi:hypothetical protein